MTGTRISVVVTPRENVSPRIFRSSERLKISVAVSVATSRLPAPSGSNSGIDETKVSVTLPLHSRCAAFSTTRAAAPAARRACTSVSR